jgi:hypothetical protein
VSVPAPKPLLKWTEMVDWLKANGLKESYIRGLYRDGKIRVHSIPPRHVKHYSAAEIQRDILDQLKA